MLKALLKYRKAFALSVLFHLVIIALIVINFQFFDKPESAQSGVQVKTVQAHIVESEHETTTREKNKQQAEQRKAELQSLELKKKADELKQKKLKAEAERQAQAKAQAAMEKKKADAAEKAAQEKAAKARQAAEALKKQQEEEKRAAAEAKKRADEAREKQAAEQRRLAEQEQRRKEAELKARLEAEESSRRLNSLKQAYIAAIRQKVERNWRRPQESGKMASCEVRVLQGPGGIILDVTFGACSGGTDAYRESIKNAVYKAEPLPKPADDALFEREIYFLFNPK